MSDINNCTFTGRLGADPETKQVGDTTLTTFSLAVGEKYKDKENTYWPQIKAWGKKGEVIAEYFSKGSRIAVVCAYNSRSWEDDNGVKKYGHDFILKDFTFLDKKDQTEQAKTTQQIEAEDTSTEIPF